MADGYFRAWDWIIFGIMIASSIGIGIFYAFRSNLGQKMTTAEYLMGGRNMRLVPVSISIMVSYNSAVLVLGLPAEMYTAGTLFCLTIFALLIAVVLATVLFVPLLYPLRLTSIYEVSGSFYCFVFIFIQLFTILNARRRLLLYAAMISFLILFVIYRYICVELNCLCF